MMTKKQKNLKNIKRMNKREKLGQLASHCVKFLENDLTQDGVESVCNIYLKHHPIMMDHGLINSFNYHPKLIW
jgi:hypothetical protein